MIVIQMKKLFTLLLAFALLAVYSVQFTPAASAQSAQERLPVLTDASSSVLNGVAHSAAPSGMDVNITISVPLRDQAGLNALLSSLYTPGSPDYHRWLSPAQFYSRFAPYQSSVSAVVSYMSSYGIAPTLVQGGGSLLSFEATAGELHSALGVTLYNFEMGGRQYYAASGAASLPYSVAPLVSGIAGLQDYITYTHPAYQAANASSPSYVPPTSPGTTSPYNPATIREAYNFTGIYNRGIYGNGVSVSIVTAFSYSNSTLLQFDQAFGISPLDVRPLQPFGQPGTVGLESTLDVEWMTAVIPNATINVIEGPNAQLTTFTNMFSYVVSNNLSSVVSTSWGTPESGSSGTPTSTMVQDNNIFKQAAAQGMDITAASGDFGAYDNTSQLTPDFPASSPYITAVGGTWLNLTQRNGQIVRYSETGWNKSGGGVSGYFSTPSYQKQLPGPLILGSRGVPDVSFSAMPAAGYFVFYNGSWLGAGGTSFGAPIWAGILGLENQLRASTGEGVLGFANPILYSIALTANYSKTFYDITQGNNGYYSAGPGYDLVTGLGSPDVTNLLLLAASVPASPLAVNASATPEWGNSPLLASLYANVTGGFAPYSVKWYLNGTYSGSGVNHLVDLTGAAVYHFMAVVTDNVSATASSFVNVTVLSGGSYDPMNLSATPSSGDANLSVSFKSSLSSSPPPLSYYLWAFGDAYTLNSTFASVTHTYVYGGNFTALVTAFIYSPGSPRGYYTSQDTAAVNVAPHLRAVIKANRTGGSFPLFLQLEAASTGGTPGYSYLWSYSNSTGKFTSTVPVIHANFTQPGSYKVSLTVTDSLGKSSTASLDVKVYNPMAVNISLSPSNSGVSPFNVTFRANVSGGAGGYSYVWTFENSSSATGNPVSHVFSTGGSKYVLLTVTDLSGDVAFANVTVSVQSLGLLNLLKGETALVVLAVTIIVAAVISYSISRRRKL